MVGLRSTVLGFGGDVMPFRSSILRFGCSVAMLLFLVFVQPENSALLIRFYVGTRLRQVPGTSSSRLLFNCSPIGLRRQVAIEPDNRKRQQDGGEDL